MPDPSPAAVAAAAAPLLDSMAKMLDQAIHLIGEDAVAANIAAMIDIPYLPESMEVAAVKFVVSHIHARVHKD